MAMEPCSHKATLVEQLRQHWFIVAALVSGGVLWGVTTTQVAQAEKTQTELAAKVVELERQQATQREAIARIDENTKTAKETSERIERHVDDLIRALQVPRTSR